MQARITRFKMRADAVDAAKGLMHDLQGEISRGIFQNAYIGYWIDGTHAGRGHMTAAVRLALAFAFCDAALHRVQAARSWPSRGSGAASS